jgi:hypothetical protein
MNQEKYCAWNQSVKKNGKRFFRGLQWGHEVLSLYQSLGLAFRFVAKNNLWFATHSVSLLSEKIQKHRIHAPQVLVIEPKALCLLGKYSITWVMPPASWYYLFLK